MQNPWRMKGFGKFEEQKGKQWGGAQWGERERQEMKSEGQAGATSEIMILWAKGSEIFFFLSLNFFFFF